MNPLIPPTALFQRGVRWMLHGCTHGAPQEESGVARTRILEEVAEAVRAWMVVWEVEGLNGPLYLLSMGELEQLSGRPTQCSVSKG